MEVERLPAGVSFISIHMYPTFLKYTAADGVLMNGSADGNKTHLPPVRDALVTPKERGQRGHKAASWVLTPALLNARRTQLLSIANPGYRNRILAADLEKERRQRVGPVHLGRSCNNLQRNVGMLTFIHASPVKIWQMIDTNEVLQIKTADKLVEEELRSVPREGLPKTEVYLTTNVADSLAHMKINTPHAEKCGTLYMIHPTNIAAVDAKQMNGTHCYSCSVSEDVDVLPDAVLMYFQLSNGKYYFVWVWIRDGNGFFAPLADFITECKFCQDNDVAHVAAVALN